MNSIRPVEFVPYPMEEPVIHPEDHPTPVIHSLLSPYDATRYSRGLTRLGDWIDRYKDRTHYPDVCPGDETDPRCQPCIGKCMEMIALQLRILLSIEPSSDLPTEYDDLTRLDRLARDFMQFEGRMARWVYVLIERKCKSLRGTRLAEQMGMRYWQDADADAKRAAVGYGWWDRREARLSLQRRLKEIVRKMAAEPQRMSDMLITELAESGIAATAVVETLFELLDDDVEFEVIFWSDDEGEEEVKERVQGNPAEAAAEEDDFVLAATTSTTNEIDDQIGGESQLGSPEIPSPSADTTNVPASPEPVEDSFRFYHNQGSLSMGYLSDPKFEDEDSNNQSSASVHIVDSPGLTSKEQELAEEEVIDQKEHTEEPVVGEEVAGEEPIEGVEEPVEDAFFASRRRTNLVSDVIEREPGQVRAPAPPQPRAGRRYF
ncbi:MAG: hypothetical protein Q9169_008593 [Polycauliona sp. 2 TL-2023]